MAIYFYDFIVTIYAIVKKRIHIAMKHVFVATMLEFVYFVVLRIFLATKVIMLQLNL